MRIIRMVRLGALTQPAGRIAARANLTRDRPRRVAAFGRTPLGADVPPGHNLIRGA